MADPPWSEADRLAALRSYAILDTPPEPAFDDAVALVKTVCRVPIALVSLVDDCRQWFKARLGVDATETALDTSVCAIAIRQPETFVIEDLSVDPRTAHMTLVTGGPKIRFYAGTPLVTSAGLPLGSLCAIDLAPRPGGLTPEQDVALKALGRQVVAQIELRSAIDARDRAITEQERRQAQATQDSAILQTMLQAQQRVLQAGGDFDAVLKALVDAALDAVHPADGVVVEMRDGEDLVYRAASGASADRIGLRFPVLGSFSGCALRAESAIVTGDVTADGRADPKYALQGGIRSLVAVPLSRHGRAFGVLKLHAAHTNAFKSRHILIAQMLAGLIAASFTESAETAALHAARRTEQSYRHIVDSAIDSAIISTDTDGRVTSWSKGAETIIGWTEEEMLGHSLSRIFTREDNDAGKLRGELERAAREGRAPDERWHVRKDGSRFYAHGAVTPLLGPGDGFVKSLRDVTDEHATRSALEASRLRLDAALETGMIGFFTWEVATDVVRGDARFAEFFNVAAAGEEGGARLEEVFQVIFPKDIAAIRESVAKIRAVATDYSHTYRTLRPDGGTRWMLVRGHSVERDGDRPLVYVGTAVDVTSQREAEDRLRLSRDRLELATRAARLGSFDFLPQEGSLDWDDRCRELFGLPPGVPVSYEGSFLAGLHPDDRDAAAAAVNASLDPAGDGSFGMEYRTIGQDGTERTVLAKGQAYFSGGVAIRLIGTVQDVTADRAARRRLLETEERLRLAVRATNDAIWDWDLRRGHVRWNEALHRGYGHAPESVEPTSAWWLSRIHPDDRERIDRSLHIAIEGRDADWSEEYRFARADGRFADVRDRGYVIRDAQGRAIRMLGALLDQSDRKANERNLEALNKALETSVTERTAELNRLWQISPDLLVVLGFDGTIERVNPAWQAILGYRPEDLLGHLITEFILPEDFIAAQRAIGGGDGSTLAGVETRYRHKDGSVRWFSWVAASAESEIHATGRHITAAKEAEEALRQAEDALRQSQKVEAIGQLTGGVAHDFNNLLTVIRGSVDLLRRPDLSEERRKRYLDAIADTSDRAVKLTSQLLAFARRSSLKPVSFDVGASLLALRDMIGTLAGPTIDVEIAVCETACFARADPSQFDTAIVNMAVNARDAMDRQGRLKIAVRATDEIPAIRAHAAVRGSYVAVSITDTGTGIPDDRIEHIFEPFFTTKRVGEGTGLGLSQVFGFAKQSGGEVLVDSRIGEGAVFTLFLPRAEADAQPAPVARRETASAGGGACILVVEDNGEVGAFATQALAELGHFTVLAADADQALAKLAEDAAPFDAVFSDVVMPGRSGIDLAKEIRRLYPGLRVLLTSGYSSVLAHEGTHGFDLIHKPYSVGELAAALDRLLRSGPGASAEMPDSVQPARSPSAARSSPT